ncbi:hypothetical protein [Streptomyces sp. NPDC053560]|uniref:hypothetical protein n=1 Tax=Streptomyces sp. NPDC053560 TaxID=3365711 RepID=UPI0037D0952B
MSDPQSYVRHLAGQSQLAAAAFQVGEIVAETDARREARAELKIHHFTSTADARTACDRDDVTDGDVLVVGPEGVVGFLVVALPAAITEERGEFGRLPTPAHEYMAGEYADSAHLAECAARALGVPVRAEHASPVTLALRADNLPGASGQSAPASGQPIEGVIVEHNGTSRGCAPRHCTDPDVIAAREALDGLLPATLTDRHDISEPADDERDVRGWVADPRGAGRVAFYWLEGGRVRRRDDEWHGLCLKILADRLAERGWRTEPMLRCSQCVFAHRPGSPGGVAVNHAALAVRSHGPAGE